MPPRPNVPDGWDWNRTMKACLFIAVGMASLGLANSAIAENNANQEAVTELEPLRRDLERILRDYYPQAKVSSFYEQKNESPKIHFEYNTQKIITRFRGKDGSWQAPVELHGPYVGGIWGDITLRKGQYTGDLANPEKGVLLAGPDFYIQLAAPYSKTLDSHLLVDFRYPGGTPPRFLQRFRAAIQAFEEFVEKPAP